MVTYMNSYLSFGVGTRQIAEFTPTIVTEETITDASETTDHPIEDGSSISDHVIIKPVTCSMEVYFNDDSLMGFTPKEIYQMILALRDSMEPFTVVLGKRTIENVVFTNIVNHTNQDSEYVLHLSLEFKQLKLVTLEVVEIATPEGQKASTQTAGKKQAQKTENGATEQAAKETAQKNNSALYNVIYG